MKYGEEEDIDVYKYRFTTNEIMAALRNYSSCILTRRKCTLD